MKTGNSEKLNCPEGSLQSLKKSASCGLSRFRGTTTCNGGGGTNEKKGLKRNSPHKNANPNSKGSGPADIQKECPKKTCELREKGKKWGSWMDGVLEPQRTSGEEGGRPCREKKGPKRRGGEDSYIKKFPFREQPVGID